MSTELTQRNAAAMPANLERLLLGGDLEALNPEQRISYYKTVCDTVGLNPLTKPFEFIKLNGKMVLYALKACTDQLRSVHHISIKITAREVTEGCYVVTAQAKNPSGREDENIGAVPIANLKGEALCNAMMKAETKAKRRVTLSICGLGMLDESEVETIPSARAVAVDSDKYPVSQEAVVIGKPKSHTVDESSNPTHPQASEENVAYVGTGEIANFSKCFREALPEWARKDADEYRHEFLREHKVFDIFGAPSTKAIRKSAFLETRMAAVAWAKALKPPVEVERQPFVPTDDDIPF